jgi:PrtD family type I secretion system ABC transporter
MTAAGVALEKLLGPRVLSQTVRRGAIPGPNDTHGLRDVGLLRAFLSGPGTTALLDSPWVPIYVVIIFLFHPILGAVAVAGAVLLLTVAIINERLSRQPLQAMQMQSRKASRFAEQGISNAEVVGALGMADNLSRGWLGLTREALKFQLDASRAGSVLSSTSRFLRQFLQVAMLGAGAWLVIEQQATSGVMIAATILLGRALAPVESAIAGWKGLVDGRSAYARLDALLATERKRAQPTELPAPKGTLSVERVVFGFRGHDRPVIKGPSFEVPAGETLVIVGPSAAGKSTLTRLLVGLWKPMSGAVRLDGADTSTWPRERLGPDIGYLPQDVELFAGTVSENIARLGEIDSPKVIDAATRANAHDMILRLPQGYDTPVGEGGAFLSAGQCQRIALARALYGSPRFVVLDEPNSNLDIEGEGALTRALSKLKEEKVTVVLVTHRASLLGLADKVLVLRDGAVEKFGTPAEVGAPVRPRAVEPSHVVVAGYIGPRM